MSEAQQRTGGDWPAEALARDDWLGPRRVCGSGFRWGRRCRPGCGAMRDGCRLFPLLLLALLRGQCHGREPAPGAVTCGSVLKLLNTRHNVRLHSHEVKYGSGEQGRAGPGAPRWEAGGWEMAGGEFWVGLKNGRSWEALRGQAVREAGKWRETGCEGRQRRGCVGEVAAGDRRWGEQGAGGMAEKRRGACSGRWWGRRRCPGVLVPDAEGLAGQGWGRGVHWRPGSWVGGGGCWGLGCRRTWQRRMLRPGAQEDMAAVSCSSWSGDVTGMISSHPWGDPCSVSRALGAPSQHLFRQQGWWFVWGRKELGSISEKGGMVLTVSVMDQIFFSCVHRELWRFASY